MTICAWVKTKTSAATRTAHIIGNAANYTGSPDWVGGYSLQILYPGRTVRFSRGQVGGSGSSEIYAATAGGITVGTWYFVAGTFDGSNVRLYMNGTLEATTAHVSAAPASSGSNRMWVGAADLGDTSHIPWFYGTVDEAAIWDRALTAGEIATLYAAGVGGGDPAGAVLTSDGTGGSSWELPTIEVTY